MAMVRLKSIGARSKQRRADIGAEIPNRFPSDCVQLFCAALDDQTHTPNQVGAACAYCLKPLADITNEKREAQRLAVRNPIVAGLGTQLIFFDLEDRFVVPRPPGPVK